jgi:hypothetical protein
LGEPAERAGEEDPSLNQSRGKKMKGKIEQVEGGCPARYSPPKKTEER